MGAGFLEAIKNIPSKRKAYAFWYHPLTELAIFALIILSVGLLLLEISLPSDSPVGWLGGMATGTITGWFFWADAVITLIFVVEYFSKLWIAPKGRKWFFVRNSWIELLALLPVLRVFRLFRIFRAVRILRVLRVLRSVRLMRTTTMVTRVFQGVGSDVQRNKAANLVIATYFVCAMLFGTIGVLIFEKGAGSGFDTIGDGLWWCIVTLSTVGYGDIVPETAGGRIIASIVVMLGLGFWSLVTGVFASTLVQRARNKDRMGLDLLGAQDHVVIVGWNQNGVRMVRDFHSREPTRHVVVVTEREELGLLLDARLHLIQDDPTSDGAWESAQIERARTVVVLADRSDGDKVSDIDARTIMFCLRAHKSNPQLRLIVELLDETNIDHAQFAGADDIVVTHNYGGALLSQVVQYPGLHRAYTDLFDVGRGSQFNEIAFSPNCVDKPFSQAGRALFLTQSVTLVGYRRRGELHIAPDDEPIITADDRAIVIEQVASARSRQ